MRRMGIVLSGLLLGGCGDVVAHRPPHETGVFCRPDRVASVEPIVLPATAPELPSDRAVGPGLFEYHSDAGIKIMVTERGEFYSIGVTPQPRHPTGDGIEISPDGRWLLRRESPHLFSYSIRDLASSEVLAVSDAYFHGWSPDSKWALFQPVLDEGPSRYVMLSLIDGSRVQSRYQPVEGEPVVAVLPDGRVITTEANAAGRMAWKQVKIVNLYEATVSAMPLTELVAAIKPGERSEAFFVSGDKPIMWLWLGQQSPDALSIIPTAMIAVDLGTGRVLVRHDITAQREGPIGVWAEDLITVKQTGTTMRLSVLDAETGRKRPFCYLSGQYDVDFRRDAGSVQG